MRLLLTTIAAMMLLSVAACSQTQTAAAAPGAGGNIASAPAAVETPVPAGLRSLADRAQPAGETEAPSDADAVGESGFPNVPDGALYTIYCMTIDTPTHVPDANHLKEQLISRTHSKDWYVIHSQSTSTIYYGFYKTFDDDLQPQEVARAQTDRRMIASLKDDNGDFPFSTCIFQPLNSPDPPAPAEWNLKNAHGYWSVQIGAYVGSPLRKQYAVDAVRAARAQGIPAYFYHGRTISSVCVGAWPREAVKEQDSADAQSDQADKHVMVLPQPLPQGARTDNIYDPDGSKVKVLVPRVEIVDPTLIAAMRQYPQNAVNGEVRYHTEQTKDGQQRVEDPSFLVVIPHDGDDTAANPGEPESGAPTLPGLGGGSDHSTPPAGN